jgi:hypothetical protein
MSAIRPRGDRDSRRSAQNDGQTVVHAPHRTHFPISVR